MQARIWGCRGSVATPGPGTVQYGGNTTSLELRTASGRLLVVDAGTGIRPLGLALDERPSHIDLIFTHLHLDHVEGLGFFAPLFDPDCSITVWGPPQDGASLAERVEAYLSPPLFPLRFDQLDARIDFVECGEETWQLDGLSITAARVCHPGPTYGYRFEEDGRSLAFIPDNEPGIDPESGLALADGAGVLVHDAQYTDAEYTRRAGWGHSSLDHFAATVRSAQPERAMMFHHDPTHDDETLEAMQAHAQELLGRPVELAREGMDVHV
jgi:phosphoribosyl 1,2-cyclic phosphodiesterase